MRCRCSGFASASRAALRAVGPARIDTISYVQYKLPSLSRTPARRVCAYCGQVTLTGSERPEHPAITRLPASDGGSTPRSGASVETTWEGLLYRVFERADADESAKN